MSMESLREKASVWDVIIGAAMPLFGAESWRYVRQWWAHPPVDPGLGHTVADQQAASAPLLAAVVLGLIAIACLGVGINIMRKHPVARPAWTTGCILATLVVIRRIWLD